MSNKFINKITSFFAKIKEKIKDKFTNFKFPWVKFSIFIVLVLLIVSVVLIVTLGKTTFPKKPKYNLDGFKMADELDSDTFTMENENYSVVFDLNNTHFTYFDKVNNLTFTSKPDISNMTFDTLTLYYSASLGVAKEFSNYNNSIDYDGMKRFMVRTKENEIEFLYLVGGKIKIDYTDLPELISKERFDFFQQKVNETLNSLDKSSSEYRTLKRYINIVNASYILNDKVDVPYLKLDNPKNLSDTYVSSIYEYYYTYASYTKEDLIKDCNDNGVEQTKSYPTFEISMKYQLNKDGLDVEVVNDSIVDYEDYPLVYVDILPFFGTVKSDEEGSCLIPDGSGILINFNTDKSYANYYESRIFGSELAKIITTGGYDIDKINFGMYGLNIKSQNKGLISIIENGAPECSIIAKVNTLGLGERNLNQIFYRFFYRETDSYEFTSLSGANKIQTWTNDYNSRSPKIKLKILNDASYTNMAKTYQAYLESEGLITKLESTKLNLNLTLLGGYLQNTNILGLPYKKVKALTSHNDVKMIVNKLKSDNVDNLNVIYKGFMNNGVNSTSFSDFNYNSAITSQKELKKLTTSLDEQNVNLYLLMNVASGYTKKDIKDSWQIRNLYGKICPHYPIDEATYAIKENTTPLYYVKPVAYEKITKTILKEFSKLKTSNIAIEDLGNVVYGSYKNKDIIFRSEMVDEAIKTLNKFANYNVMIKQPSSYALKNTLIAYDVPFSGTNYQVQTCSVPFYQLVLSGYVNLVGPSINLFNEHNFNYYKMKSIETCSQIAMTWTASNTIDLINTEYNYYYSTYYLNWYDKTVQLYKELETSNIFNSYLTKHMNLDTDGFVTISEYANGAKIIFNYNDYEYDYEGSKIMPNSYYVLRAGD